MELKDKVRRLEQLKRLRGEVDMLSQRLAELEQAALGNGARVSGMPGRLRPGEFDGELAALAARLEARRTRCMELLGALYAFIDDIDDSLMRQIMTYRYIDGRTWQSVARKIGEVDEQYPRRLHNRFLARAELGGFDENDGESAV